VKPLLCLLLVAAAVAAHAENPARQWVDEMSEALRNLDYDGTFVYLHDGKLEAMRIIHRLEGGGEKT